MDNSDPMKPEELKKLLETTHNSAASSETPGAAADDEIDVEALADRAGKAKGYFPCSEKEVSAWLDRINDIDSSLHDFLNEDPEEERKRTELREAKRVERERRDRAAKTQRRYNTSYYASRFDDNLVEQLLKEVDQPPPKPADRITDLTGFERLAIEESEKAKAAGNDLVKRGDYEGAHAKYDNAVGMAPLDPALRLALRNNRAMCRVKLGRFAEAVEDATYVVAQDAHNVKARLRRAAALVGLHRPAEALADVQAVLIADSKNREAVALKDRIDRECAEIRSADHARAELPKECDSVVEMTKQLREMLPKFSKVLRYYRLEADAPQTKHVNPTSETLKAEQEGAASAKNRKLLLSTDDACESASEEAVAIFLKLAPYLDVDDGLAIAFRLGGGIDIALRFLDAQAFRSALLHHQRHTADSLNQSLVLSTAGTVLWSACLRVLASACRYPVAAELLAEHCLRKPAATNPTEAQPVSTPSLLDSLMQFLDARSPILTTATLRFLGAALSTENADVQRIVWEAIGSRTCSVLPDYLEPSAPSEFCFETLRFCDELLKFGSARDAIVGKGTRLSKALSAVAITCIKGGRSSTGLSSRAASSMLLRLTTDPTWAQEFASQEGQLDALVQATSRNLLRSDPEGLVEGLASILTNMALTSTATRISVSQLVAADVAKDENSAAWGQALCDFDPQNVARCSRLLGLMAKSVGTEETLQQFVLRHAVSLSDWLDATGIRKQFAAAPEHCGRHADVAAESVSLLLATVAKMPAAAAMFAADAPGWATKLASRLSGNEAATNPRLVGNTAVILGAGTTLLSAGPPDAWAAWRTALKKADCVKQGLEAVKVLHEEAFSLDREGKRSDPLRLHCTASIKNIGSALAGLAGKDEEFLSLLREARGFEILKTATGL